MRVYQLRNTHLIAVRGTIWKLNVGNIMHLLFAFVDAKLIDMLFTFHTLWDDIG